MPFNVGFAMFEVPGTRLTVRAATLADAEAWERAWEPDLRRGGQPAAEWPWREHISRALIENGRQCLVVENQGRREAMASLTLADSRVPGEPRRAVYVEYIGVAPENLAPPVGTNAIRGLGTMLMREAARLSFALGFEGRVGLHSKRESEDFYRRLEMSELKREEMDDGTWLYFELEPMAARRLMGEI